MSRRRRRIALLGAALAGVAALISPLWRPPAQVPPQYFRVELQVSAVDSALWFAARYPEYFTSGETGLKPWLDGLEPNDREFVLAMAQTLTWTWVEHESRRLTRRAPETLAREAAIAIRGKVLNQLEVDLDNPTNEAMNLWATITIPEFSAGVFARLVRGASNCEGQNHLLALLIDYALVPPEADRWWYLGPRADITGVRDHNLAMVHGLGLSQPIFVDAWSNLQPFCADPLRAPSAIPLAELEARGPLVDGLPGREPSDPFEYALSRPIPIEMVPERDAPTLPVSLKIQAPALDEASLARIEDPWRVFLFARILQLYDDPRAGEVYRHLLERHCDEKRRPQIYPCAVAIVFRDRGAY